MSTTTGKGTSRNMGNKILTKFIHLVGITLLLGLVAFPTTAMAEEMQATDPLELILEKAGIERHALAPNPYRILSSSTQSRQLPFFRSLMGDPLRASYRVGMLESSFRTRIDSPHRLIMLTGSLAGADVARGYLGNPFAHVDHALLEAEDPLRLGLAIMILDLEEAEDWDPFIPEEATLPHPLRFEIGRLFAAIGQANRFRERAFADFPDEVTPNLLLRQAIQGNLQPFEEPDYRRLFHKVEREALMAGMLEVTAAMEDLDHFIRTTEDLPEVQWSLDTPLGMVVIDTTGADNEHVIDNPLLVIDVGGDDVYTFTRSGSGNSISLLYDHGGNDHYMAKGNASCPSSAIMGYGILWDTGGNDIYEGEYLSQSGALFGASLLIDGGGNDSFSSRGHSQAFALGGAALLLSMGGDDTFNSLTHAQGCGASEGAAVLINVAGNDRYTLGNTPLIRPSAQLPDRNTSRGRGAGRGRRADLSVGRATAGGIGALLDIEGDDVYTAQVFAQG
ncbi:MAG: hypothetical protein JJU11_08435, partial [Candidatus Sumerlaeia bacterium]|nr:hypothetical protein [Candidatus Sumerlaeia bacterium]